MTLRNKRRFDQKLVTIDHQALKKMRHELGLTLKEAGQKLNLSEKTIGAIENGRISLNQNKIEKVVHSYGLVLMDFTRSKRIIKKDGIKLRPRKRVIHVLSNHDRRSYQKIINKNCKVLRSLRRIKKLSQDDASKLCGYSRPTIGHIENGRIELSKNRILHIVKCYGYGLKDFEDNIKKSELRDEIIDFCVEKIEQLSDEKLILIQGILKSI